jgi:hypothetical protein
MSHYKDAFPESMLPVARDYVKLQLAMLAADKSYSRGFSVAKTFLFEQGLKTYREVLNVYTTHGDKDFNEKTRDAIENIVLPELGLTGVMAPGNTWLLLEGDTLVGTLERVGFTVSTLAYEVRGSQLLNASMKQMFEKVFTNEFPAIINRLRYRQGVLTSYKELVPPRDVVNDIAFLYPYLDQTPAQVWDAFMKSKSNVLLLLGPPGTGKSSFIMEMMRHRGWGDNTYLADRSDVLADPSLADFIRELPFGSTMITEDSDLLVAKRDDGNSGMQALLNATSGIASRESKIIISTNLSSVRKVDEALLRPGRMFKVLEFRSLNADQVASLRTVMSLPSVDLTPQEINSGLTLAEALNYDMSKEASRKQHGIGF